MSDAVNPYESPAAVVVPVKPLVAQGSLTEIMLIYLKQASPWLRFVGILGFIGAGLAVLSGFSFFVLIPLIGQVWGDIPGFDVSFCDTFSAVAFGVSIAVLCIGSGVLLFFPSLFVYRFGERIRSFLKSGKELELEQAFKNNKSLWKFLGIFCIINLAFLPLMIIGAVFAVIVSALA